MRSETSTSALDTAKQAGNRHGATARSTYAIYARGDEQIHPIRAKVMALQASSQLVFEGRHDAATRSVLALRKRVF